MTLLADFSMLVIFITWQWIVANALALAAVGCAFSPLRHRSAPLVLGLLAAAAGIWLTLSMGWPTRGVVPAHWLSWCPLVLGGLALWRWNFHRPASA